MKEQVLKSPPLTFIRGMIQYVSCSLGATRHCSERQKNNGNTNEPKTTSAKNHHAFVDDYGSTY